MLLGYETSAQTHRTFRAFAYIWRMEFKILLVLYDVCTILNLSIYFRTASSKILGSNETNYQSDERYPFEDGITVYKVCITVEQSDDVTVKVRILG